jgi:hypothetical protein
MSSSPRSQFFPGRPASSWAETIIALQELSNLFERGAPGPRPAWCTEGGVGEEEALSGSDVSGSRPSFPVLAPGRQVPFLLTGHPAWSGFGEVG